MADPLALLENLYKRYLTQNAWQNAAQNRMQAAGIVSLQGRTDLFREYTREAAEIAGAHGLERLELDARMLKFRHLLSQDLGGQTRQELQNELKCELADSGVIVTGALIERLDTSLSGAVAAYDTVLAELDEPSTALAAKVERSRGKAAAYALSYLEGQFADTLASLGEAGALTDDMATNLHAAASQARAETIRIGAGLRMDLLMLAAAMESRLDAATADDVYRLAEQDSDASPEKRVMLYMQWADHADAQGRIRQAIGRAKQAVEVSLQISTAALAAQAKGKLEGLISRGEAGAPVADQGSVFDGVMRTIDRAQQELQASRFGEALHLADQALTQSDGSPLLRSQLRRSVLRVRALAFYELGQFEEAEADCDACIEMLSTQLTADAAIVAGALDARIQEEEGLYLLKAFLSARKGLHSDAWNIAEQGRACRLKREILASGTAAGAMPADATFDGFRPWLKAKRAAVLSFAATRWGTLVLTAGPDDEEPLSQTLADFPAGELKRLLAVDLSEDSEQWTTAIFRSVPDLSAGLIHDLVPRLRDITRDAEVLYIIPNSYLYYAPFAALTLDGSANSQTLIDLIPLAFTPSTAILRWSGSRTGPGTARECLAIATGHDSTGFEFHDDLPRIAAAPWPDGQRPTEIRDADATAAAAAEQAPHYDVLYFSCHGALNPRSPDLMAQSQLQLAASLLNARDVASWKLSADLVFLNACQAGRFPLQARGDVNGFVRAFPLAGARSLIAPLIHVDSEAAADMAESFFQAWLGGESKARALRSAQIATRRKHPDRNDWAAYCLVGDCE